MHALTRSHQANKALSALVQQGLTEGQQQLADTVRQLICKLAPQWFEKMDFSNDHIFLEPLLIAWLTHKSPAIPLEQLLCGLIKPDCRPFSVSARTDHEGTAFMAGLGCIQTSLPNTPLTIHMGMDNSVCHVSRGRHNPSFAFYPVNSMQIHGITVFTHINPLLQRFFEAEAGAPEPPLDDGFAHMDAIRTALELIAAFDPEVHQWMTGATRAIQLYKAPLPNSFATLSAHGIAFCNVKEDSDVIFFADDLAHQCGHIIFNAVTLEKRDFIAIDPHTPLRDLTHEQDEGRDVYSAFHGLFTYTLITRVLNRLMHYNDLSASQRHHCLGRIAFYLYKFYLDLGKLDQPGLLTARGLELYQLFATMYEALRSDYVHAIKPLKLDNQPYVFSQRRFLQANPVRPAQVAGLSS